MYIVHAKLIPAGMDRGERKKTNFIFKAFSSRGIPGRDNDISDEDALEEIINELVNGRGSNRNGDRYTIEQILWKPE